MALSSRPLIVQLARDVLARWATRATGLPVHPGDTPLTRPSLPYVSLTFPRGRPMTGPPRRTQLSETLGSHVLTPTAAEGAAVSALLNGATVTLTRGDETPEEFAALYAAALAWWGRGRISALALDDAIVVEPLAPGLLLQLAVVDGLDLDVGPAGAACRLAERLYRAVCRVKIVGAPAGAQPGEVGDGLDPYTIEAAMREELSEARTRAELRGVGLVPHGLPDGEPGYASTMSGAQRETGVIFDLEFGWTGWHVGASEALLEADLGVSLLGPNPDTPALEGVLG